MPRQAITNRELLAQLDAEASRVSASGLDEQKRDQLAAIRRRIDQLRLSLRLKDELKDE